MMLKLKLEPEPEPGQVTASAPKPRPARTVPVHKIYTESYKAQVMWRNILPDPVPTIANSNNRVADTVPNI